MKKLIAFVLVLTMALGLFAACGNKVLTQEEALKVVAKDLDVNVKELANAHIHIASGDVPAYSIYVTVDGVNYDYLIAANGGEILHGEVVEEAHSH